VFESSIVFLPAVSPETLKPYSYASIFAVAFVSSPPWASSPSTLNSATPNFQPWPSLLNGAS